MTFHNRILNSSSRGALRIRAASNDLSKVLAELKTNYSDFISRHKDGLDEVRQELEETNARMTRLQLGEGREDDDPVLGNSEEATLAVMLLQPSDRKELEPSHRRGRRFSRRESRRR